MAYYLSGRPAQGRYFRQSAFVDVRDVIQNAESAAVRIAVGAWGVGSVFPSPRPNYHSSFADKENNNNIEGLKDKRVDEIIDRYDVEFDEAKRVELLRELDSLLANSSGHLALV